MTAKQLFEVNGDFKNSPLLSTVHHLNELFTCLSVPYAVIGGVAVVRNGAVRTTVDVDVLTTREGWVAVQESLPDGFKLETDSGLDLNTGVEIDILFPGDDWEMVIPMPHPAEVAEFDESLGGWFIDLFHLLELKTTVFIKKRDEDGIEVAAKDLADIVALIGNNRDKVNESFIQRLAPAVREDFQRIVKNIENRF